uniref:G protein-coupled receptor 142 n=1 Tax=Seriola dumerili TaxID=41447 RepID=A0A3B4TKN8_SERDU
QTHTEKNSDEGTHCCVCANTLNILTAVALSRLASRTKKALYYYLLAVTGSDILSQLFIIFVGFLLETAVFHRDVPALLLHSVSAAEFAANHASIWSTVPLTVDRYVALCHPLLHRQISYPARARKIIAVVLMLSHPPTALDTVLIWTHVTIIYFLPCSIFLSAPPRRLGKTTAMLLAITSVFSVLWAPRTIRDWRVHLAYDLSNMLAMLNTAVNFFLYCFVSKPFRGAVRDVVLLRGAPCILAARCHNSRPPPIFLKQTHLMLVNANLSFTYCGVPAKI